jgi:CBS domain-containing protein
MQVAGVMRRDAAVLDRNDTVQGAAQAMAEGNSDAVVVTGEGALVGLLTARDILVRVVVKGLDPAVTPLFQVMTPEPAACTEDEDVAAVIARMAACGVHHLPVLDAAGRPVGLVAAASAALLARPLRAPR